MSSVGRGLLPDPAAGVMHEVDIVALDGKRLRVLGEVKWGRRQGSSSLARLEHLRTLALARGLDVSECRLALFSGSGFTPELRRRAGENVILLDLERVYGD